MVLKLFYLMFNSSPLLINTIGPQQPSLPSHGPSLNYPLFYGANRTDQGAQKRFGAMEEGQDLSCWEGETELKSILLCFFFNKMDFLKLYTLIYLQMIFTLIQRLK